jgi:hypothetical protein
MGFLSINSSTEIWVNELVGKCVSTPVELEEIICSRIKELGSADGEEVVT